MKKLKKIENQCVNVEIKLFKFLIWFFIFPTIFFFLLHLWCFLFNFIQIRVIYTKYHHIIALNMAISCTDLFESSINCCLLDSHCLFSSHISGMFELIYAKVQQRKSIRKKCPHFVCIHKKATISIVMLWPSWH